MKKLILIALAAFIALLPLVPPAPVSAATPAAPFEYAVWLPFWKSRDGATEVALNLEKIHTVSPFSYELNSNGTLIDSLKINGGSWDGWLSAVRDSKTKIVPTIAWFNTRGLYNLLSNTKKRIALEDDIAALVKAKKFDGIDIDFEAMSSSTKPYFSTFIYGLSIRLKPMGKTLACTVVPRMPVSSMYESDPLPEVFYAEDYAALNKYCDEVRIMAYDQGTIDIKLNATKGNGTLYAPVADPAWVEKVIKETLKTISPKKVMLGIPTYGYGYQMSWNMGAVKYQRTRSFTYKQAMERIASVEATPVRNSAGELSFTFTTTTYISSVSPALTFIVASTQPTALAKIDPAAPNIFFVSFSDAKSTADKIALAKKYGLRGAVLFKADGEMDPATWAVMK